MAAACYAAAVVFSGYGAAVRAAGVGSPLDVAPLGCSASFASVGAAAFLSAPLLSPPRSRCQASRPSAPEGPGRNPACSPPGPATEPDVPRAAAGKNRSG